MTLTKQQLYDLVVIKETDLYNTKTGYYVSGDKENNEIIVYYLDDKEASYLAKLSKGECWLGFIGVGGNIYNDPWEWILSDSCTDTGWVDCRCLLKE